MAGPNIREVGGVQSTEGITPDADRTMGESRAVQSESASRNQPQNIVARLKASLPKGTTVDGSFHRGGTVMADGKYALKAGETVTAAPQTQQDAPDDSDAAMSDENAVAEEPIQLQRAFSRLQEAITKLADESGVRRSATVNYIHGQDMHEHTAAVAQTLTQAGGLAANLMTSHHHTGGRGWGSGDGSTQAWPADKLRTTIIPQDNENAKAAIAACRSFVNKVESLIGEDKSVTIANSQIKLV